MAPDVVWLSAVLRLRAGLRLRLRRRRLWQVAELPWPLHYAVRGVAALSLLRVAPDVVWLSSILRLRAGLRLCRELEFQASQLPLWVAAHRSVLGSWVAVRRLLHHYLFLTASRMVLPKILVLTWERVLLVCLHVVAAKRKHPW